MRQALHDGLQLARLFRAGAIAPRSWTAPHSATCRMYRGFGEAWAGFVKNAREGMATPLGLPIWTVMLAGAHLWPSAAAAGARRPSGRWPWSSRCAPPSRGGRGSPGGPCRCTRRPCWSRWRSSGLPWLRCARWRARRAGKDAPIPPQRRHEPGHRESSVAAPDHPPGTARQREFPRRLAAAGRRAAAEGARPSTASSAPPTTSPTSPRPAGRGQAGAAGRAGVARWTTRRRRCPPRGAA